MQQPQQPQQLQRQCAHNDARDVRRNVDFMDGVNESDDLTQEQPLVQHSEAPEKSGVRRVTTCECGGLDRDESGDAGEEPGAV